MQVVQNEDMHIPARFWADPASAERDAVEQAMRLCKLPFAVAAAFMPNLRPGAGFPVGTVFATDGYYVPNGLATDIGCGIAAARTTVRAEEIAAPTGRGSSVLQRVLDRLARAVPSGDGEHGAHAAPQVKTLNEISTHVLPVPGLAHPAAPELVRAKEALARALKRAPFLLGTLGGRHHFLELQSDEDGYVWIVVHAGSRGLGAAVCALYDGLAASQNERWLSWIPGRPVLPGARRDRRDDLAFLPPGAGDGRSFALWTAFCIAFAAESRARMVRLAEQLLFEAIAGERTAFVDTPHTYAAVEQHDGRALVVHRTGAARAEPGTWTCVAGSARTGNWIVEGSGMADAIASCPHDAGRAGQADDEAGVQRALLGLRALAHPVHRLRPLGTHRG